MFKRFLASLLGAQREVKYLRRLQKQAEKDGLPMAAIVVRHRADAIEKLYAAPKAR